MADKIPCFAKVNIPDLAKLFDSKYKEGMSEAEQRQIGTDIALDYHKKLFEELNTFKEKDLKIKLTKEQKTYVSPDKSEAIKKITDDYQKQIDEANTPTSEPTKVPVPKSEGGKAESIVEGERENVREHWALSNEYRINELAEQATSEKHFKELIDKEIELESKKTPKLAQDDAESKYAVGKLTEQNQPSEELVKNIERKAESQSEADLNEVVQKADELIDTAVGVKRKKLSEINTDESRFQGRGKLNEGIVNEISKNFSDADQDPIHIWADPKDGKTYVLSGHHRYYGAKKAGRADVKVIDRTKDFTEQQAIKFAKEEANANRSMETPLERANTLREKRQRGDDKKDIAAFLDKEGKNKTFVDNLSYLNPKGKAVELLTQFERAEDKQTQKESERIADWIGEARKRNENLTNQHENEMFDYLKSEQRVTNKVEFVEKVSKASFGIRENEPLNLKKVIDKSENRIDWEDKRDELKSQVNELKSQTEKDKQTGWTGLQKDYITRLANDRFKGDADAAEKEFKKTENQEIYNKKLEDKKAELKSIQDKLAKHLLKENDLIKGDKAQQNLFEEPEPEYGKIISIDKNNPTTVEIKGEERKLPTKPAKDKQLTYTVSGFGGNGAVVTIHETPTVKGYNSGKIQHSEIFNTFNEAFEYADRLKKANVKQLYEYQSEKENKTLPATGRDITDGGRTTSLVSENNPQYGNDSPYQKALRKVREKTPQSLNETKQEPTKDIKPEQATEKPQPEKTIVEDKQGAGKEPPIEPPKKEGVGGENKETAGITHAANEVRRQERGLPEYQKSPTTEEKLINEAEQKLKDGYDVEDLMDRLEKGETPEPVENFIRKIYIATIDAEVAKNPTDALLAKQKRFAVIGDIVNSKLGLNLWSLKGSAKPLSSISDFYVAAMEAKNTDKLTDAEKAEVQKDYADVVAARQKAEKAEKEATAKYEEMKAENELLKQQLAAKNKAKSEKVYTNGKRDFKAEIKNYKDELIKAKEEHLKWMKDNGIQTSSIGGNKIVLNQKMAKIILKIAAVHVEQIGVKIAEVTKKTWEDVKDIFDGITEKDIWDVFNGVYNEKKLTRDNIVAQMRELKTEAKLLSEYENLLKKGEPKPEVEKQKRNQRLTDLRNKIDALKKEQGVGKYSDEAIAKRAIDANKRKMEDFSRRLREGEFEKEKQPTSIYEDIQFKKKNPKLYNELLDSQTKAHDAQLKFEKKLVEEEMKKWGLGDKLRNWAKKFSGTLKTLFASFDASAILIQNLPFMGTNPGIGAKGVARSYRGFLKQKAFDRYLQDIHNSPDWPMIRESIRITEPKSLLESGREEFFPDRFKAIVTIKGKQYGWIKVKGSKYELMDLSKPFERQFTMLGNILRITKFRIEAEKLYQKGFTWEKNPEEFKTLGKRINNLTSSSDIPQAFQNEVTRTFIWSSRLIAAKLNMLGLSDVASMIPGLGVKKGYYRGLGVKGQIISRQQAYAAADLAKFATSVVIASYLYALARGGTLNTDPDDTGFLDVEYEAKDGSKKSMNFSGGFSRVISLIFQMASGGKRKDGVFRKYGGWSDPVKEAGRFVSGKAPPLTRTTLNIAAGKDMGGKEADIATEASNYKMPLAFGQIYKQIERDGLGALFTEGLLMYIGVNSKDSRDYDKKDNTISITDPETFKKRNVTPEEQKKYEETKEKGYNTLISDYERGKQTIWVDVNDDINIPNEDNFDKGKPKNLTVEEFDTWKEIKYSKLTPEQKKQLEGKAKRRSSAEAKKELFGVDEDE